MVMLSKMLAALFRRKSIAPQSLLCPVSEQVAAWRKANRKMRWGISEKEFDSISEPPILRDTDISDGFSGAILSYGFGDDGQGNADAVMSGKLAWDYALRRRKPKTWQCEYIDFDHSEHFRLRPDAPLRPKGFYFSKLRRGERFQHVTVTAFRKQLASQDSGCGPEGFQLLTITHPHWALLMHARQLMFVTLADYDVAPYGYGDFFDAPQMFCSNATLGLGIGHVDRVYPLFGIPTIRY